MNKRTRLCDSCKKETTNPKFCSRSCAAKVNNNLAPKRIAGGSCKTCMVQIRKNRTFCKTCWNRRDQRKNERIQSWKSGLWSGGSTYLSKTIRSYLLEKSNFSCQKCGFSAFHSVDGKTILEINHINGNGSDHRPENLEVLCPNCHALTDNYRGRNSGNGRKVYYLRIERD